MTTREAAERLQVTERQVCRMIGDGRLPATRRGKSWAVSDQALPRITYAKGLHREARVPHASRVAQPLVGAGTYQVKQAVVAHEMTRICRQLYPDHPTQYDLGLDGQPYQITCTAKPSAKWWRDCEKAAIRFRFEMDGGKPRPGRHRQDDEA